MTFREFIKCFPDEVHCRDYLYKLRFPQGFVCPKCEYTEYWKVGEQLYECTKCGRDIGNSRDDDWGGFSGIENKGYKHFIHVQKYTEDEDKMLPHLHTIISLLKRWLLGTHQGKVSPKHLQAYLDEYVFRFNRRKSAQRGLLFYRLLESAMRTNTTTYKELTKNNI